MSRAVDQFAWFFNAVTPTYFVLASAVYAVVLFKLGYFAETALFVVTLFILLVIIKVLKVVTNVERRRDMRVYAPRGAFPSGHAASAAFVAVMVPYTLAAHLPVITVSIVAAVVSVFAIGVALSRLTLRVHTALQVSVGTALGIVVPLICIYYLHPLVVEWVLHVSF